LTAQQALTTPFVAKLTVEDFLLLDRSGAFDGYAKTELINGTILVVNAQFSEHMTAKVEMLRRLADACDTLETGLQAWSEGSIDMSPDSMPEPDLFITNARPAKGAVRLETVVLIGEVADTTLRTDLGEKAALYARHGVPEYWVIDLGGKVIHQMWAPEPEGYRERREVALGEQIRAVTVEGLAVETLQNPN